MTKIKITEDQLKKLMSKNISENLDMADDDGYPISIMMVLFSHLSDIQSMSNNGDMNDRINFLKTLIKKYPDTKMEVSTRDLDAIYDSMLGRSKSDNESSMKNVKVDKNPFDGGFDLSMNESNKK